MPDPAGQPQPYRQVAMGVPLSIPTPEAMELMGVRRFDWHRIHDDVSRVKDRLVHPLQDATTWAATFFGMAFAAALGVIPVATATQEQVGWVYPAFGFGVALGLIMGILCIIFGRDAKTLRSADLDLICSEMKQIEAHSPPVAPTAPPELSAPPPTPG
jgi:hypothetical protein